MRLLTRIGLFCILIGLIAGLILRAKVKNLFALVLLSFLPWLIHLVYVVISVLGIPLLQLGLFVLSNLLILILLVTLCWPALKKRNLWTALLPVLQGFIYSLSLLWFVRVTALDGLGLNSLSWVTYAGAALAMGGLLLGYMFRVPVPKLGSLMKRRSK
jgi:hypothetical protein